MKKQTTISKYPFIKGTQCTKAVYLHYHKPELKTPYTPEEKMRLGKGKRIGQLARNLFPGGIDVSEGEKLFGKALVAETQRILQSDTQVLYEPGFLSSNGELFFAGDILVRSEKRIRMIEVKSKTHLSTPEHIYDVGIQWRVLMDNGFPKHTEIFLAYINPNYVRNGNLDTNDLFTLEDVTSRAKAVQPLINRYLYQYNRVLEKKYAPQTEVGEKCFKPYPCPFKSHCFEGLPQTTVFDIGKIKKKKAEQLMAKGIVDVNQLPRNTKLNDAQWIEVDASIKKEASINEPAIKQFLNSLELDGPLFFMDFETMMPAVPIYEGTTPYSQICFQYCVVYRKNRKSRPERMDFVAEPGSDPRREFIRNLIEDTAEPGNIIVYNKSFEITRLKELAVLYPEYAEEIDERISRIKDPMYPFEKKHYYHHHFKGKYSIKVVLPILVPGMSYDNLEIKNGDMAMNAYENIETLSTRDQSDTIKSLKEYCYMDVLSMVMIIEALERIVSNNKQ
jgi:hypothetical protein